MVWVFRKSILINIFQVYAPYRVKEPGFLGGKQRKLKQKAFESISCFLFEKTDGAHISATLAVQSQRAGVSRCQEVLERLYILLRKHGDRIP